jgi:hypothetical protein
MRYLLMHKLDESHPIAWNPPAEFIEKMGGFMEEVAKAGVLLAAEGVLPSAKGAKVRHSGGRNTVTDGPFAEAKEVVGGFALLQVRSKEEAIEWASRFAALFGDVDVEVEVRQVAEMEDIEAAGAGSS